MKSFPLRHKDLIKKPRTHTSSGLPHLGVTPVLGWGADPGSSLESLGQLATSMSFRFMEKPASKNTLESNKGHSVSDL